MSQAQAPSLLTGRGGAITVTAPAALAVGVGQTNRIPSVRLTLSGSAAKGEIFVVTVMNDAGGINVSGAGGVQISGARPTCITLTGSLAQVNAALATMTDQAPASGNDTLTVVASDSLGDSTPTLYSPITIAAAPVINTPSSETVRTGVATLLTGLSIAETNWASSEIFTVTLTAASGVLTERDRGSTGSGTDSVTIRGGFKMVNRDLNALSLAAGGPDTIVETVTDSFGNTAVPVTISVNATASGVVARFAQAAAGVAGPASALSTIMPEAPAAAHLPLAAQGGHAGFA